MEKRLPWMADGHPTRDRTIALPGLPEPEAKRSAFRSVTAPHQVHQNPVSGWRSLLLFGLVLRAGGA